MAEVPIVATDVPITLEEFGRISGSTYRLRFTTIADDGDPTTFDEEVEVTGRVDDWLDAFLEYQQERRAAANRKAIEKASKRPVPKEPAAVNTLAARKNRINNKFRQV